jgi:hypothetical protein
VSDLRFVELRPGEQRGCPARLVEAVFTDPALLRRRLYKQRLLDYRDDDTVSPLLFWRPADRDPDQASVLFQKLLRRPTSTGAATAKTNFSSLAAR